MQIVGSYGIRLSLIAATVPSIRVAVVIAYTIIPRTTSDEQCMSAAIIAKFYALDSTHLVPFWGPQVLLESDSSV